MERRTFLRVAVLGGGAAAFGGSLWLEAFGAPAQPGVGPYGPLRSPDANAIALPAGFTSRVVARSRQTVPGTSYRWHDAPDGGACFSDGDGWIYVSNSEIGFRGGGAGAVRFGADGGVRAAYRILSRTNRNCAGGATPWNTWLSCEESFRGQVFETDPFGQRAAVAHPDMGRFTHEAAAVDPVRKVVYLTEDERDGCFYRFRPTSWPNLSAGTLEVLCAPASPTEGAVTWQRVPNPSAPMVQTRHQVSAARHFNGGEGCYYADGSCWFTTKGDNRVWRYEAARQHLALAYDDSLVTGEAPLTGVDNIVGSRSGDLFVAEDGGNMEICLITPDDVVAPFLRIGGQGGSEITGPAFSPDGKRLYFSSQRGTTSSSSGGITYEVQGPFRSTA